MAAQAGELGRHVLHHQDTQRVWSECLLQSFERHSPCKAISVNPNCSDLSVICVPFLRSSSETVTACARGAILFSITGKKASLVCLSLHYLPLKGWMMTGLNNFLSLPTCYCAAFTSQGHSQSSILVDSLPPLTCRRRKAPNAVSGEPVEARRRG